MQDDRNFLSFNLLHNIVSKNLFFLCLLLFCAGIPAHSQPISSSQPTQAELQYEKLKANYIKGWNTWNSKSVLSHVLMPEGFALNLGLKNTRISNNQYLKEAYISSKEARPETVIPGAHAYDGSYTSLTVKWEGTEMLVESASENDELVLLITPLTLPDRRPRLFVEAGMLWNRPGEVKMEGGTLRAQLADRTVLVRTTTKPTEDFLPLNSPYLSFGFDQEIGIYTGGERSLSSIKALISKKKAAHEENVQKYGDLAESYRAMQSVLAWNVIYEPHKNRVISPVSRIWNDFFGGFVLFDWDTYFGAYTASLDNKGLAYSNAIEITKSITEGGFIPNYVAAYGLGSPDRSQPPVGSFVVKEIYKKYQEKWFLELLYDDLLRWNRWWPQSRSMKGLLAWGSDSLPPPFNDDASNRWQGAAYESGLDNSPMYDDVPFNKNTHMMELADVGLTSLYIWDCESLSEIAAILGKKKEAAELRKRADLFRKNLQSLWHPETGLYLNKRTDKDEFSHRLSPTLFYPLLAQAPTPEQARRMVREHLLNPEEFYGEYMIPSIARNDSTFVQQDYWRGRIWAPMNLLVYLGLRKYPLPEAKELIVKKSRELLMKNWQEKQLVYENYNAITGEGRMETERINASDSFYHWGGLLGLISFIEAGYMDAPK